MMKKTGKVLTVAEFAKSKQCFRCGIVGDTNMCQLCEPLKECKVCGLVLKPLEYIFYHYEYIFDPRSRAEIWREYQNFRMNPYPDHDGIQCADCAETEKLVKNRCFIGGEGCENEFENSVRLYNKYGNICPFCREKYSDDKPAEEYTNRPKLIIHADDQIVESDPVDEKKLIGSSDSIELLDN